MAQIRLTGIGWDHPRCMAPLLASLADYRDIAPEVEVKWSARSLYEFGEGRLAELLDYDLVVFDHPYCGEIAQAGHFCDLSPLLTDAEKDQFRQDSLGPSWQSYHSGGGIWGLPLDAAAQVASFRADLLADLAQAPPRTMEQVVSLAERARARDRFIALPSVPTDAICTFLTLCANSGHPVSRDGTAFPDHSQAVSVLEAMRQLVKLAHPASLDWNPIRCYEHMATADEIVYVPFAFGYSNYARPSNRKLISFCDIPGLSSPTSSGSVLGGAGLGISARSAHPEAALNYARFLCGSAYQSGAYVRAGGQPASRSAWRDAESDRLASGFFSGTLKTLDNAYLRPTYNGYLRHFRAAGVKIASYLRGEGSTTQLARWLQQDFLG